ncbi:MAG: hypothetical protein JKY54_12115 [Flavobacteriales bacterium]|nr:hypothetical protein [Flavobacteriales bacterium]
MIKKTPLLNCNLIQLFIVAIAIFALSNSTMAQENNEEFQFAYNGQWKAGDVKVNPDADCLEVKNGTMASFKMILMINNGSKIEMFEMPGNCLSDKHSMH